MNHLKDYLKTRVQYMLTYADENAKGFFKKQGFSETILIARKQWKYYIKEYDSATLRCCELFPQVNYQDVTTIMGRQREKVYRDICARSHFQHIYHLPDTPITDPLDIPGVREAGWTQETLAEKEKSPSGLQERLGKVLEDIWNNPDSWPFKEPVAVQDVPEEEKARAFVLDTFNGNEIYTTSSGLESNLIELAGGINVTRGMADARWFNTSVETLVETAPDVIIINDYGSQTVEEKLDFLNSNPALQSVPAVKNQNYLVIPLVAVMQDVRAASACRTFAMQFYPECFPA